MLTFDDIKQELGKRVQARATELSKDHYSDVVVVVDVMLEEMARLEFRMRALAAATIQATGNPHFVPKILRAIEDGKDLP